MIPRLPVYDDGAVEVYLGDARDVLAELPSESVDCCVTSPPYWTIRDFGVPPTAWGGDPDCAHRWETTRAGRFCRRCDAWLGSLGLEPSPDLYAAHVVEVFDRIRRVLKPTGTVWLNMGDSFFHAALTRGGQELGGLKPKDLVGVPWLVAFALRADGWYLRGDLVWHKANPAPSPSIDRPIRAHEFAFLLSKQARYFYDAEAVREPAASRDGTSSRHMRSVLTIATEPFRGSHTATFPTRLVEPCVLAGSSAAGTCSRCGKPWERIVDVRYVPTRNAAAGGRRRKLDRRVFEIEVRKARRATTTGWRPTCECGVPAVPAVVLDPFAGTGTTLAVARALGRRAVGIEANAEYRSLIEARLARPVRVVRGGDAVERDDQEAA